MLDQLRGVSLSPYRGPPLFRIPGRGELWRKEENAPIESMDRRRPRRSFQMASHFLRTLASVLPSFHSSFLLIAEHFFCPDSRRKSPSSCAALTEEGSRLLPKYSFPPPLEFRMIRSDRSIGLERSQILNPPLGKNVNPSDPEKKLFSVEIDFVFVALAPLVIAYLSMTI